MVILTLNCGSSSAKYQVYDWENKEVLANGVVERVGAEGSGITHKAKGKKTEVLSPCPTHKEAIELIMKEITDPEVGVITDMSVIKAVGHRVLHGGDKFTKSVIITPDVLKTFREVQDLGPLHNPANIMGIEAAQKVLPDVPHCAIMDTAWHQTMPEHAFMYAIPREWYEKYQARKYGFHGTSFLYTSKRAAVLLNKQPKDTNVIICHIGNGASICAVKNGQCYDTSMGITPLDGLVMGTRSGEIDPALPFYIMRKSGMSADEMDKALNKKSGLLGITEKYADRRDIEQAAKEGDKLSALAIEMESYRLKKYIGSYVAALGTVDAIVFTAGVGENGPQTRNYTMDRVKEALGIEYLEGEPFKTPICGGKGFKVSGPNSKIDVLVIPTNEELMMCRDTYEIVVKGQ